MSIGELGALGEFVAAIAVLVTLVYLAVQIKQTRLAVSANTHQALNDVSIHLYTTVATNESLATAFVGAASREQTLTPTQLLQFRALGMAMIRNAENMHYQHTLGLLSDERIRSSAMTLKEYYRASPYFFDLWMSSKESVRGDFRDWMDLFLNEDDSGGNIVPRFTD